MGNYSLLSSSPLKNPSKARNSKGFNQFPTTSVTKSVFCCLCSFLPVEGEELLSKNSIFLMLSHSFGKIKRKKNLLNFDRPRFSAFPPRLQNFLPISVTDRKPHWNISGQLELSEETLKDKDEILGGSRSFLQQFRTRMDGSS